MTDQSPIQTANLSGAVVYRRRIQEPGARSQEPEWMAVGQAGESRFKAFDFNRAAQKILSVTETSDFGHGIF